MHTALAVASALAATTTLSLSLLLGSSATDAQENPEDAAPADTAPAETIPAETGLRLGAFSVSLAVDDLAKSKAFYQKLGFRVVGGNEAQNWLILRNADKKTIGLFHGMFKKNIMTFNPGWSDEAEPLAGFTDIREIQRNLKKAGVALETEVAADDSAGPASLTLLDPDGNRILIDQHR